MSNAIRIETDGVAGLARAHSWLTRHRGRSIELDSTRQLEFGVPISGAGAVLVAVTVEDGNPATPQLGGVVRVIANRANSSLLVFEGRSPAHLEQDVARSVAEHMLGAISHLIEDEEPAEDVA